MLYHLYYLFILHNEKEMQISDIQDVRIYSGHTRHYKEMSPIFVNDPTSIAYTTLKLGRKLK